MWSIQTHRRSTSLTLGDIHRAIKDEEHLTSFITLSNENLTRTGLSDNQSIGHTAQETRLAGTASEKWDLTDKPCSHRYKHLSTVEQLFLEFVDRCHLDKIWTMKSSKLAWTF